MASPVSSLRKRLVIRMATYGLTREEAAQQMGLPLAEVNRLLDEPSRWDPIAAPGQPTPADRARRRLDTAAITQALRRARLI